MNWKKVKHLSEIQLDAITAEVETRDGYIASIQLTDSHGRKLKITKAEYYSTGIDVLVLGEEKMIKQYFVRYSLAGESHESGPHMDRSDALSFKNKIESEVSDLIAEIHEVEVKDEGAI